MSDIRYDLLHDDYVLIAPERLRRPECIRERLEKTPLPPERCPFCEGNERRTPHEIFALREGNSPDAPGWRTRVVPNLYKAVRIEAPWKSVDAGPYVEWEGFGAHEVLIDTPRHLLRMDEWRLEEYRDWLRTLQARLEDLRKDLRLVYVSLFKNHGSFAGATQSHPHSQIIALPVVPRSVLGRMHRALDHYNSTGSSPQRTVVEYEKQSELRIVSESERFIALCPYASAAAFELSILAKDGRTSSLEDLDDAKLDELATLLKSMIEALYAELGPFDFNITFNTPPLQKNADTQPFFDRIQSFWGFELRIVPRLYGRGGFEIESAVQINPVAPEEAATLLRSRVKARG